VRGILFHVTAVQRHSPRGGRILPTLLLAFALALIAGCSNRVATAPPPGSDAPGRGSPEQVLQRLRWAIEHKDVVTLSELFTDDYLFLFSQQDSAGNAFRDRPWTRDDEIIAWQHLLVGGGTEPPADRVSLDFTNTLVTFPSTFPGHDPKWHKTIRAEVNLRVVRGESTLEARGPGLFYFVRGDSAAIPADLVARGFEPDSAQWWIDRWEDETIATAGARLGASRAGAQPSHSTSFGAIKALYR